jgi:glutamyl-Q tRNA(Asp) synthetase
LQLPATPTAARRFRLAAGDHIEFSDAIQGHCEFHAKTLGDPVIFRRDQTVAYQLAVVVDDAAQGITDVVRGADLLECTAWQIRIGQALKLPQPRYAHIPLLVEPDGTKLAKSRRSVPATDLPPTIALTDTLELLGQQPPDELRQGSLLEILDWGIQHWRPERLAGKTSIFLPS